MAIHEYEKYDMEKKKYTSITYTDIDEIAVALNNNYSTLFRLENFLMFFVTPDSLDKAVYVFMNTYDAESEGNSHGIQCYKTGSKFVKCMSLVLWIMLWPPILILGLLDSYINY